MNPSDRNFNPPWRCGCLATMFVVGAVLFVPFAVLVARVWTGF